MEWARGLASAEDVNSGDLTVSLKIERNVRSHLSPATGACVSKLSNRVGGAEASASAGTYVWIANFNCLKNELAGGGC